MIYMWKCDIIYHFTCLYKIFTFHVCLSDAGIVARVAEPVAVTERDSDEDGSMDPYDALDYEDQFLDPDAPDSPGLGGILQAILKRIPECIDAVDLQQLSDLLPHMEPVQVATRTVQEAIAVSY